MCMGYTPAVALMMKSFDGRVCRIICPPTDLSLLIWSVSVAGQMLHFSPAKPGSTGGFLDPWLVCVPYVPAVDFRVCIFGLKYWFSSSKIL